MSTQIKRIETHRLADGGLAIINKLGHSYSFTRTYDSFDQAPDVNLSLNKNTAYKMLADTLKNDVMEAE